MHLRPAAPKDVEQIASLHAESWRTAYRGIYPDHYLDQDVAEDRLMVWRDRLGAPPDNQAVLIAENGSLLQGFICIYGAADPQWGSLIDNLHVAPERKRGGIGTMLMREGARWLHEHYPLSGVYLWVLAANAPARRFYEKLGAHDTGVVETETPGGGSAMSCRYVWPTPNALHQACLALGDA